MAFIKNFMDCGLDALSDNLLKRVIFQDYSILHAIDILFGCKLG
jgi:hypothetical protein